MYKFLFYVVCSGWLLCNVSCGTKETFTFVQLCDTQLGMGGYEHDKQTFRQAVQQINILKPDFAVICGDLVHHATDSSYADFKSIVSGFEIPCYLAPGNHDVGNIPTEKSLSYYREVVGSDYFTFHNKGVDFVVTNTQFWKVSVENESDKHHKWVANTLDSLSAKHASIFVIGHYPLFVDSPDEKEKYFNLPLVTRKELLKLFENNKVKAYLSGHTHRTVVNTHHNIQLVSGETTSKNFDNKLMGFRLWSIEKDTISHQFVPLTKQFEKLKQKKS